MNNLTNTRNRIIATLAGATALLIEGIVEIANTYFDFNGPYRLIESLLAAGMLLTLAGVYELHVRSERPSRTMNTGFAAVGAGQLAIGLVACASAAAENDVLGPVFALGALAMVIGTITVGVSSLRRRAALAAMLPVVTLVAFAIPHGGLTVIGAYWLTLAATLTARRPAASTAVSLQV